MPGTASFWQAAGLVPGGSGGGEGGGGAGGGGVGSGEGGGGDGGGGDGDGGGGDGGGRASWQMKGYLYADVTGEVVHTAVGVLPDASVKYAVHCACTVTSDAISWRISTASPEAEPMELRPLVFQQCGSLDDRTEPPICQCHCHPVKELPLSIATSDSPIHA